MKVLLTGGSGMLGRALCAVFSRKRPEIELLSPSRAELNLLSASHVDRFLADGCFDLIIHCAAKVGGIQANIAEPFSFLYENAATSLNVIHGAANAGVRNLIFMGSSCMYPRDFQQPLREDYLMAAPLEPTNEGYAVAKIMGAKLCEFCNRQFGTAYKTFIPCNLYGPYDHFDLSSGHLIAALLLKLHQAKLAGAESVTVWGDGTARREFLYCIDLAEFICDIAGETASFPDFVNLGYGCDFSVMQYYEMGAKIVGYCGKLQTDPSKPAGMKMKLLDSRCAASLGWKPRTPPELGMQLAYDYLLKSTQGKDH